MELPRENVQDYPRPPRLEPAGVSVSCRLGGEVVAESRDALRVLETHHAPTYYIPPEDVRAKLVEVPGSSWCEWKGRARYFDVVAGGRRVERAAWAYPTPTERFAALRDHLAFYPGLMDACFVGGVQVTPQPGDFYGGWVTPNLDGIVKGDAATRHW